MEKGSSVKPSSSSSIRAIFMHADVVDKWLMALGFLGALGDGLSTPAVFFITSKVMNDLGGDSTSSDFTHNINKHVSSFLYLACGAWVACFIEGYCWTRTGERQASRMRARYLKAVLRQDVEYFDLKGTSMTDVITSVSSDSLVVQDVLGAKVPNVIMTITRFIGSYLLGFLLDWRLALVALPTVVLLIVPGVMCGRILMGLAGKIREEYNKAGTIAEQAISSVRTVYSFVGERRTVAEFSAALEVSLKLGLRQGLVKGVAVGSNGITYAIWALMLWYSSHLVIDHGARAGSLYSAGGAIIISSLGLGWELANLKSFSEASSAAKRIMEVIRRVPKIDSDSMEGDMLESVAGDVELRGVVFAYPSRREETILREFNLKVPAGKTVALVGRSGSGKSTVIALLERFYDPASGEIMLDGVDIRRLQIKWLRSQMGLVSQEPALFATSIKENILFGKEDASMEEVVAAAKAANAHNFISQLPQGYDTQVGEGGVQISGGQKQRIAIARAVLKSPKILLLDEATSALDSESERAVQAALDIALVGRTAIVIAHRLSTIKNVDEIAVVQSGHVMETGSHDELILKEDGLYTSFVRLQETARGNAQGSLSAASALRVPSSPFRDHNTHCLTCSSSAPASSTSPVSFTEAEGGLMRLLGDWLKKAPEAPSFSRLLLLLNRSEWKQAALGCLNAVLFGGIEPTYGYFMGIMVDVLFLLDHDKIKSKTRMYALVFLFLSLLSYLVNIGQHYNLGAMGEYLAKRVREHMLSKILTLEVAWFDRDENSTGAICSRLAKDANVARSLVGDLMPLVIQTLSMVSIATTIGLIIAWRLALVVLVGQPIIFVCFYTRRMLLKNMSTKAMKEQLDSSKLAAEAVSNLRTVTAFSSQDRILRMFEQAQEGPRRESVRQSWYAGIVLGTSYSLMTCTWALNFWYGGRLIRQGSITAKALFQTNMVLTSIGRIIADASSMTSDVAKGAHAVSSIFAILDHKSNIEPEDPDGHLPEKLAGAVDIRGIDFAYPARPDIMILKDFSLSIEAGKSTALVGQSGSGKSTIISLLERFYDPIKGTVQIDGRDIKSYHLRSLRRHIALVGQEPALFSGTVRENIIYGVENASEDEIEGAARAANAHDFINHLNKGYNTWCGDRGLQLSGGQKQRIAIARAILKKPAILLLDEATSALDSRSEKLVQDALERLMVGRTSIVVAHRLSTIQTCDQIVVMAKGSVVEKGTHASLLAKGPSGSYYSFISLQQCPL